MTTEGAAGQKARGGGGRGLLMVGLAAVAFVVIVLALLAAVGATIPDKPVSERVQESCDSQYGAGTDESKRCQITLLASAIEKAQSDKLQAAKRDAGL